MARRKEQGSQSSQSVVAETVVEDKPGETHIHRTVREWHAHAPERLAEIEAIIDSWGRRSTDAVTPRPQLDYDQLEAKVDKITRRVKGSQKVVVKETVTEWVERPVAEDGPEAEPEPTATEEALEETTEAKKDRPRRHFLGFIGKKSPRADRPKPKKEKAKAADKGKDRSDPEYQPQCSAITEDGQQCRNSARGVSRYCASHKGYQPPTAKGLAKRIEGDAWDPNDELTDRQSVSTADTLPAVPKAKDTRLKVRKAPKPRKAKATRKATSRKAPARKPAKKSGRKKR